MSTSSDSQQGAGAVGTARATRRPPSSPGVFSPARHPTLNTALPGRHTTAGVLAGRRKVSSRSKAVDYGGRNRSGGVCSLRDHHHNSVNRSLVRSSLAQRSSHPSSRRRDDEVLLGPHLAANEAAGRHRRDDEGPPAAYLLQQAEDLELLRHRRRFAACHDERESEYLTHAASMDGQSNPPQLLFDEQQQQQEDYLDFVNARNCRNEPLLGGGAARLNGRGSPAARKNTFGRSAHGDDGGHQGLLSRRPDYDSKLAEFLAGRYPSSQNAPMLSTRKVTHEDSEMEGGALLKSIPEDSTTMSKILDLAMSLGISPADVVGESLEQFYSEILRRRGCGRGNKKMPTVATGDEPARRPPSAAPDLLLESSMEVFNSAQRLAHNFPDVGVSLVVTPRNGRQLVFVSDGMKDDDVDFMPSDDQQRGAHQHPHLLADARGGYGHHDGGDVMAGLRRHHLSDNSATHFDGIMSRAQLVDDGGEQLESFQRHDGSSIKKTVTASMHNSDKASGHGRSNEALLGHAEDSVDREDGAPQRLSTNKRKWRDIARHLPGRTGVMTAREIESPSALAPASDEPDCSDEGYSDGDGGFLTDAPAHKRRICRQRWTHEQMQELRRVVSESVPYGRWEEVFERSEVLRASHFTKQAVRKKAVRMGLARADGVNPIPSNSAVTADGGAQEEGRVVGYHDDEHTTENQRPLTDVEAAECGR